MIVKLNTINDVKNFVGTCEEFKESSIDVKQGRWVIDGKSIMGIFSLDLTRQLEVTIDSDNEGLKDKFYSSIQKWEICDN